MNNDDERDTAEETYNQAAMHDESERATVEDFAALVLQQTKARMMRDYPRAYPDGTYQADTYTVNVKPRKVYTLVDVGPAHNISGKYMVENATGIIYGIKGYGKVHKGHRYGTLDTIDAWDWGGYRARKIDTAATTEETP